VPDEMTTLFRILIDTAGLSLSQATEFLDARSDSVMSWSSGRRTPPGGILNDLHELLSRQHFAAQHGADTIIKKIKRHSAPEIIDIGICVDDHEARSLGWPTVSAHAAVIGCMVAMLPHDLMHRIRIVPRGSSAAADAHRL
jgi:hypothetical protein